MRRDFLMIVPLAAALAFAAGVTIWRLEDSHAQSGNVTQRPAPVDFGGPFSLTDQFGQHRTDQDFRGKFMLVYFGYTYCPDICPTTLAAEAEALDKLGARASRIVPIFISVDPKRDTPEKLRPYLASFDAMPPSSRPNFIGLTGSDEEIARAAKEYRVYYQAHLDGQTEDGADYSVDHSSDVYLMSPEGKFVAYYSAGILPDEMAADLMRDIAPR
jgi:protein SCO1/2